jgi:hypothetical protein
MTTETIETVKSKLGNIDQQIINLQAERFTTSMRLSVLLAQAAKAQPLVESSKQLSTFYDAKFGGSGFEERTA